MGMLAKGVGKQYGVREQTLVMKENRHVGWKRNR